MHQDTESTDKLSIERRNFLAKGLVGLTALAGIPTASAKTTPAEQSKIELGPSSVNQRQAQDVEIAASGYDHTCVVWPSTGSGSGAFGATVPDTAYATENFEFLNDSVLDYGDTLEFSCDVSEGSKDVFHWDGDLEDFCILRYDNDVVVDVDGWPVSQEVGYVFR